jgi:hypothetical protein
LWALWAGWDFMTDVHRLINEAEGLAFLGLYLDAWEALEELPSSCRLRPAVLAVRLMICTGLERWELGSEVARVIPPSYWWQVREAAGPFHLAHAVALCGAGDVSGTRVAVGALAIIWPEGRRLALQSKDLEAVW